MLLTMGALYAKRKCTVEPVFSIIKAILGFRQFSLRGMENVGGEFNLVAMAWNLKRMFVLAGWFWGGTGVIGVWKRPY